MINEHVLLTGPGLVLVPYLKPFVPRYHEWMCDPALLAATESEPLSLDEEYENQHTWLHSSDKLTFIILAPIGAAAVAVGDAARLVSLVDTATPVKEDAFAGKESAPTSFPWGYPGSIVRTSDHTCALRDGDTGAPQETPSSPLLRRFAPTTGRHLFASELPTTASLHADGDAAGAVEEGRVLARPYVMVGDCNLFLLAEDEDDADSGDDGGGGEMINWSNPTPNTTARPRTPQARPSHTFEVEVMVADTSFRRRGLAEMAVRMLMQYAVAACGAIRFVAKVLDSNDGSIALFTHHLNFALLKEVKVFHEMHFTRRLGTAEERAAWKRECEERGVALAERGGTTPASSQLWWCGPLTERVKSSLQVYTQLPAGCVLP